MIAYNPQGLQHLWLIRESQKALYRGKLSDADYDILLKKYPTGFYTPNILIRLGLFFLVQMAASSVMGLLSMALLLTEGEKSFGYLLLAQASLVIAVLEHLIKKKKHYESGVDDALLWLGAAYLVGSVNMLGSPSLTVNMLLVLMLALLGSLRYLNYLMSAAAVIALLVLTYLKYKEWGDWALSTLPLLLMTLSLLLTLGSEILQKYYRYRLYENCLKSVQITALVCLYVCGNFFVLNEIAPKLIQWPKLFFTFDTFFWVFTLLMPLILLLLGIRRRNMIYLRLGLLLLVTLGFQLRYYYHKMPIEWLITLVGAALALMAYLLTRYLKKPRQGIVSFRLTSKNLMGLEQAEALLIAHTMGNTGTPPSQYPLGGGSSGGGGATENF